MNKILMDEFAQKGRKLGYKIEKFDADRTTYRFTKDGKSFLTLGKHFPINSVVAFEIAKRKDLTKQILGSVDIPVPAGILTDDWGAIEKILVSGKIKFPLVVKPDTSSLGKFVVADIGDIESLKIAFDRVKEKFGKVLVEEYFAGEDYRFLVLDGKVLTVAHRVLPYVIGDGKKNVSELSQIKIGKEVTRTLSLKGLSPESIPADGEKVTLRKNANIHTGATLENVTEKVSEFYDQIAIKAAGTIGLTFSGVDILSKDITREGSDYVVTEVNADPGYDVHTRPVVGEAFDATNDLLNYIINKK